MQINADESIWIKIDADTWSRKHMNAEDFKRVKITADYCVWMNINAYECMHMNSYNCIINQMYAKYCRWI